jgi:hypothetical protein
MKKEQRTIPVQRVHLALPHHGRLRLGRLKTLCDKQAVSELPLFATIEAKSRCRTCFGKVDEHGYLKHAEADVVPKRAGRKPRPSGEVIPLPPRGKKIGRAGD